MVPGGPVGTGAISATLCSSLCQKVPADVLDRSAPTHLPNCFPIRRRQRLQVNKPGRGQYRKPLHDLRAYFVYTLASSRIRSGLFGSPSIFVADSRACR